MSVKGKTVKEKSEVWILFAFANLVREPAGYPFVQLRVKVKVDLLRLPGAVERVNDNGARGLSRLLEP